MASSFKITKYITFIILTVIYYFIMQYFNLLPHDTTISFIGFGLMSIIPFAILALLLIIDFKNFKAQVSVIGVALIALILFIVIIVLNSRLGDASAYRNMIGEVEKKEFVKDMKVADLDQIPIVDHSLALNMADKKLGEVPSLGSQSDINRLTLQEVNGVMYYVGPLEHTGFFKYYKNKVGTKGYLMVNASNPDDVKLVTNLDGKKIHLRYLDSAYFGDDLMRYAFRHNKNIGLKDYTFEIDDNGKPYWVISKFDYHKIGGAEEISGVMVIDAQTGHTKEYSLKNAPSWIERMYPADTAVEHFDDWGTLIHGYFNWSDRDKIATTEGIKAITNNGKMYYYTGVSSVGRDESLSGFTLIDTRTGHTTIYKISGATEKAGMTSAEGKVQQFRYNATYPTLINIQNEPTYFMALKDKKGLIKMYSMVNVRNYNIVGTGNTLQSTLNNYIEGLAMKGSSANLKDSDMYQEIEGKVSRIGLTLKQGESIYDLMLEKDGRIFSVSTEISREIALTKIGDPVKISFIKVGDTSYILAKTFDNKAIQ